MKVTKVLSDDLESSYAVARLQKDEHDFLLVASEVEAACFAYNVNANFEKTEVWSDVGGTMSIVQIPNSMDFLATQKFYPGFNAAACQIVRGIFKGDHWEISKMMTFPYLHRFDLVVEPNGEILFIGCTIANSKAFIEDWSDKGKIFVGKFDVEKNYLSSLKSLPVRVSKNHGYFRAEKRGYSLITGVEGVLKLTYPSASDTGDWRVDLLFEEETSDIIQLDLYGDKKDENIIIQDFHGDKFRVLDDQFEHEIFRHPVSTPFGHALWGGKLSGEPVFVFGHRSQQADLLLYRLVDGELKWSVIDHACASSNCLAFEKNDKQYIFSANNGRHEIALYEIELTD